MNSWTKYLLPLLMVTLILVAACEPRKEPIKKIFDQTGKPMTITVYTYDSQRELDEAFRDLHNARRGDDVDSRYGFARWHEWRNQGGQIVRVEPECEIHVVEPKYVDDEETVTLGHELLHCLYGSYHGD